MSSSPKFKKGDRIFVLPGAEKTSTNLIFIGKHNNVKDITETSEGYWYRVGPLGEASWVLEDYAELEQVYNSPLGKALR